MGSLVVVDAADRHVSVRGAPVARVSRVAAALLVGVASTWLCGCSGAEDAESLMGPGAPIPSDPDASDDGQSPDADADGRSEEDAAPVPRTIADLVVDGDRDGKLEPTSWGDQEGEDGWTAEHGAVFLANLDDDDGDGAADADDEVVNGADDALDLARIRLVAYPDVHATAAATLRVDAASVPNIRMFRVDGDSFSVVDPTSVSLTATDIEQGVEFAIEARYFVRSLAQGAWNGRMDVHLSVQDAGEELGSDDVRVRVAPLVFMNNVQKTERVWVGDFDDGFVDGVKATGVAAGVDVEVLTYSAPGYADSEFDQWTQDHFEMGYTAMPSVGGLQKMLVAFRTPRVKRTSADIVFVELRSKDFGAVHVHSTPYDDSTRSLDSTGNFDTIPPHEAHGERYPLGRFILGSTPARHADLAAEAFIEAQEVQPVLRVDTSWLTVGHVDEFLSFVKADTPRGWRMLFARPALARQMLQDMQGAGFGSARLFQNKWWWTGLATRSVDAILADAELAAVNQEDQATLDAILLKLRNELELGDDEIEFMPFLEQHYYDGLSVAYQPATVNLLSVDGHLLISDPLGPVLNGVDAFKADLDGRLGALGLTTHYVDDWDTYHRNNGDVHCGTNSLRAIPDGERWWESGR